VIYLDSSVALAQLLAEGRSPPASLGEERLVSSRLLEYEVWNRIHVRGLGQSHGHEVRALLARVDMIEMDEPVLARALEPFPIPVRTLDALHLATIEFLRGQGDSVELASYDNRLLAAAQALGVLVAAL
jgi:predicted nucleic acid-binding protein